MNDLEQLMLSCNDGHQRFRWLKYNKEDWLAQARPKTVGKKDVRARGETAYEAVKNLIEMLRNEV